MARSEPREERFDVADQTMSGDMDPAFLDLPGEVIRLSMRTHQKYFAVRDPKTQKLAPHFVVVANVEAKDGGKAVGTALPLSCSTKRMP